MDLVTDEAIANAEQNGIIFIDEIDKIASGSRMTSGADVSREGVQRDIFADCRRKCHQHEIRFELEQTIFCLLEPVLSTRQNRLI